MNTAQSQELCHIDEMLQGLLNGLGKSKPTAVTTKIKHGLLKIQGRVHQLLNTNPMFKEEQLSSAKGSNSPVEPSDSAEGAVDVYRPFADVLEGFTHAVAAKGTNLKTGQSCLVTVLTVEKPAPGYPIGELLDGLLRNTMEDEIGWTILNHATVVNRK